MAGRRSLSEMMGEEAAEGKGVAGEMDDTRQPSKADRPNLRNFAQRYPRPVASRKNTLDSPGLIGSTAQRAGLKPREDLIEPRGAGMTLRKGDPNLADAYAKGGADLEQLGQAYASCSATAPFCSTHAERSIETAV